MKQAIALFLADTHLSETNIPIVESIFTQASAIAIKLGLTEIDHAGDIFNSRKAQTQVTLDAFDTIVSNMHLIGLKLNVVVGNHDKTDYGSQVSFLKQFRHHPGVQIFSRYGNRNINEQTDLFYLSFFEDQEYINQFQEMAGHNLWREKNILLTHIGIAGSVMNNGTVIESASITPSLFSDFDLTLVGHFHDAQILAGGKIRYIGASLQHNYGELTDKGVTILYDDLSTEIIPLKYPQYIKYEVSPGAITAEDLNQLKEEKATTGDNIRVILVGTDAEVKSFNKQILIDAGVSVEHKIDTIEKVELENRVQAFDVKSLAEEFEIFCKLKKLNKEEGMKYFKTLIAA